MDVSGGQGKERMGREFLQGGRVGRTVARQLLQNRCVIYVLSKQTNLPYVHGKLDGCSDLLVGVEWSIFYADDLCLLAPCAIALQKLLDICHEYGVEHDVIYNPLKSVCIVFKPDRFSLKCPLVHLGNIVLEYQEKVQ